MLPHRFPGILCSMEKGKKAQAKRHGDVGHPKEPLAGAAGCDLPEEPAAPRFGGLLCRAEPCQGSSLPLLMGNIRNACAASEQQQQ